MIVLDIFWGVGFVAAIVFIGLYIYSYNKFGTAENSHEFPGHGYSACAFTSVLYSLFARVTRTNYLEYSWDVQLCIALDVIVLLLVALSVVLLAKRAHKSIQEAKQFKVTIRPEVGIIGRFVKGEITKEEMEKELEELQE